MANTTTNQDDWGEAISLEGRVNIYPGKPLPELGTAGGVAVAARLVHDATQDCFALVCAKGLFPRVETVHAVKMLDAPTSIRLREGGIVDWPAQGARHYALVYERPLASVYWRALNETHPTMSEDSVNRHFIEPLISVFKDYQRMGIMHGGIRPTNIFWRDGSTTPPQLGDGLSGPPGAGQPAVFETIERAMCAPAYRGNGLHSDDCYAFGATLAFVLIGRDPFAGMNDNAILHAKMERGSFTAFLGSFKLHAPHVELLRGLLADDARQRWSAEDMEQWLTGRRLTPKSSDAGRRAARHFDVGGKEYWQIRPLAAALAENPAESVKTIENGALEKWITRSLGDAEKAKDLAQVISDLKESGSATHYEEQLVARACLVLDPSAPIRYRGLCVTPAGVATGLVEAVLSGTNVQTLSEIIINQFVTLWVNLQKDMKVDLVPLAQQLERMRGIIEKTSYGNGLERALYELNPSLPCLSPMLRKDCVVALKNLLPALERVGASGNQPREPMDRHIAAFLIVRDKRGESVFNAMSAAAQNPRRILAILTILADLQYRFGPDNLPKLAAWFAPLLEPCFKRFLSKPMREKVKRQAEESIKEGNLALLLKCLDDPKRVTGDEQDFLSARLMYQSIKQEMADIEREIMDKESVARAVGMPVAATVASILALTLIALMFVRALVNSMV